MSEINSPEFAKAKKLSDFVIFVKEAESVFVTTKVQLNHKGQLFIDFESTEEMYYLCMAITKHLMFQKWKFDNEEISLYTDAREKRAILTPYKILSFRQD